MVQLVKIPLHKHQDLIATITYLKARFGGVMLVRWRQEDPRGLLASQPNLFGEFLAVSNHLKRKPRWMACWECPLPGPPTQHNLPKRCMQAFPQGCGEGHSLLLATVHLPKKLSL